MEDVARLTPEFLLRHEGFVLALARSLVQDDAAARDVAQETWLTLLDHRPRAGSVRGWLTRVVRSRASNLRRGELRRADHERSAARSDAQSPPPSAREELELQHRLVSAVLALDEPYRTVVIAVYFRGRAPNEVARDVGVPASTLRSQLSRALDLLRARLDREHDGSRRLWSATLALWIHRREGLASTPVVAAGTAALAWPVVAWSCGLAAAGLIVFAIWRQVDAPRGDLVAASRVALSTAAIEPSASRSVEPFEREPASASAASTEVKAHESTSPRASPLDEVPAMLVRMRQIKALLLDRALSPEPDLVAQFAWLTRLPGAGVARVLDRARFGHDVDLPWLDGGGAFFSFTQRTHDYQRHPQIALSKGTREFASGFYGHAEGLVIDLGEIDFQTLVRAPGAIAAGLDPKLRAAWDYMHREVRLTSHEDGQGFSGGLRKLGFDDDADIEPGHSYLLRAVSPSEFDVVVALHAARVQDRDGVTFAWRVLETRQVADERPIRVPSESPDSLPAPDTEQIAMDDAQLRAEFDALRELGTRKLFAIPVELAQLAAGLTNLSDGGVVRILDRSERWTEFASVREGGAYFSFARQSHSYDEEPDISCEMKRFRCGFYGSNTGWFLELGDMPLDLVRSMVAPANDAAWRFLWTLELPHGDARERVSDALADASTRASALGLDSTAGARTGTTWLLRSVAFEEHDLLVAFRVAATDSYGHFLEWRLLKSWTVPPARR